MRKTFATAGMLLAYTGLAHAVEVYPGCAAAPGPKAGHHTFYVDPVRGSDQGDGSAAKPWKNLGSVIGIYNKLLSAQAWYNNTNSYHPVNPNGPVKAGDVIMLMSGNYGSIKILNSFNDDFVWIMAAPNQTPVINSLAVVSSAKFVFQGIKFQAESPDLQPNLSAKPVNAQIDIGGGDYTGSTNNIVFDRNTFSATDNTKSWSEADWIMRPYFVAVSTRAPCTSMTHNRMYNVFNGTMLGSEKVLFADNTIDHFTNDGIDLSHGYTTVRGNSITNSATNKLNGYHPDGIQGWSDRLPSGVWAMNTNVIIEDNTIIKWERAGSYMQGISIYDGHWDNLVVQNNVVVSDTTGGISVFGAKNSKIVNNTLIAAGTTQPFLWIQPGKDKTPSSNVLVRNNIAPILAVAGTGAAVSGAGIIYDHNIFTSKLIGVENGKVITLTTGGQVSAKTSFSAINKLFNRVDETTQVADLRLKNGSPAIGAGTQLNAPDSDITGKKRRVPVDLGAYSE